MVRTNAAEKSDAAWKQGACHGITVAPVVRALHLQDGIHITAHSKQTVVDGTACSPVHSSAHGLAGLFPLHVRPPGVAPSLQITASWEESGRETKRAVLREPRDRLANNPGRARGLTLARSLPKSNHGQSSNSKFQKALSRNNTPKNCLQRPGVACKATRL